MIFWGAISTDRQGPRYRFSLRYPTNMFIITFDYYFIFIIFFSAVAINWLSVPSDRTKSKNRMSRVLIVTPSFALLLLQFFQLLNQVQMLRSILHLLIQLRFSHGLIRKLKKKTKKENFINLCVMLCLHVPCSVKFYSFLL